MTKIAEAAAERNARQARGPHPKHSGTPSEPSESTMRLRARQANEAARILREQSAGDTDSGT